MNKLNLKKMSGTILLTGMVFLAGIVPAFAGGVNISTGLSNISLTAGTSTKGNVLSLKAATHYTTVKFDSVNTAGDYIVGFYKKDPTGVYNNSTAQVAKVSSSMMNRLYTFSLNGGTYREYVSGKTAIGHISSVLLLRN